MSLQWTLAPDYVRTNIEHALARCVRVNQAALFILPQCPNTLWRVAKSRPVVSTCELKVAKNRYVRRGSVSNDAMKLQWIAIA